jgi:hypothetical protein
MAYLSVFSWVRNINFVQNQPIQVNLRSTVALDRESLLREERGSNILLSIVNCVSGWKDYCLPFSIFMGEEHHRCAKNSFQMNGEPL